MILLPGYVRRFAEAATPLIDLALEYDVFNLAPKRPMAADGLHEAMDIYPEAARTGCRPVARKTASTPSGCTPANRCSSAFNRRCWSVVAAKPSGARSSSIPTPKLPISFAWHQFRHPPGRQLIGDRRTRPTGLRQEGDGAVSLCPLERMLLLRGAGDIGPGGVPLARLACGLREAAEKRRTVASLDVEPSLIKPGEAAMIAYSTVLLTDDPEERERHDADVEAIALDLARAHEEAVGARVHDLSRAARVSDTSPASTSAR